MRYLFDTDFCIHIIKKKPATVLERLMGLSVDDVAISAITLGELEYGVKRSVHCEQNQEALAAFISPLNVLPFDSEVASYYGDVRADLEQRELVVGALDLMIVAHAMCLNLILVTHQPGLFQDIPGLQLEDWTRGYRM